MVSWGQAVVAASRCGTPDQQVHLAAQAEAEDRVEQGRDEREAGGDRAEQVGAGQEAGQRRRTANPRPTAWANRGGAASSSSPRRPSRGRTSVRNSQAYGVRCTPSAAPSANSTAWTASRATVAGDGAQDQRERQHDRGQGGGELRAARVDLHPVAGRGRRGAGRVGGGLVDMEDLLRGRTTAWLVRARPDAGSTTE